MKPKFTRFALVATLAAVVGVFLGVVVYFTLVTAVVLLVAVGLIAVVIMSMNRRGRPRLEKGETKRALERRTSMINSSDDASRNEGGMQ